MKSITSLFAIIALSLASSLRAQEETPTPSPSSEEPTSATIQAPSSLRDASPSPSAEETPAATSSETKKAETSSSPSASPEKKTSTASSAEKTSAEKTSTEKTSTEKASTEKASAKAAATPSGPDKGSPESNVKRLESDWEGAVKNHDVSFIQARVAEDFIGVSSKGKKMNKSGLVKEFKADTDTYSSAKSSGMTVRAHGDNVAVVNGTAKEVGKTKDGKPFSRSYIWTDTWVLRGGKWQCVASQVMLASGK